MHLRVCATCMHYSITHVGMCSHVYLMNLNICLLFRESQRNSLEIVVVYFRYRENTPR
jgi:hypothetical protein